MKVWILQLMALSLALHQNFMANAHDSYEHPEPKPIIRMNASDEDWKVANFAGTESRIIVGLKGLCLEVYRFAPKLVTCKPNATEQKWKFLADGTIRPETEPLKCLTSNELKSRGVLVILQCRFSSSAYTVWRYRSSDNAIVNPVTNLVMDLSESRVNSDEGQIFILFPSHGGNNQKWYTKPQSRQLS